ncbi:MAG: TetR/AcrR family transcriptional regulator [Candidatus Promineifilaceae bacterium]|jgi:AcrR family transcriptional regulator
MARRPDPERREQFLSAALALFAQKGVQNTSTAAIAKRAGSAVGTLFLYFPTKQDLINELVLQISRENSTYIKSQLTADLSPRESFRTIWQGYTSWFLENKDAYRYIRQIMDSGEVLEEITQETTANLDYYFAAIQKGITEGAIKPYPPELIGGILYQDIVAVMNLISTQPDAAQQEAIICAGFEIFWNGIKN